MDDNQNPNDPDQIIKSDTGEADPASGSAPEDVMDIDQEEQSVGLHGDDNPNGPGELNAGEEINQAEKQQD